MDPTTAVIVQAWVAIGTLLTTLVLALVTAAYVLITKGMLGEMRKARELERAPFVVAHADPGVFGPELVVRNAGGGPAFEVAVRNLGPTDFFSDASRTKIVKPGQELVAGVYLAPGQAVRTMEVVATMGTNPQDYPPVNVECQWQDAAGGIGKSRAVVDFGHLVFAMYGGSLRDIATELSELRSEVRRLAR